MSTAGRFATRNELVAHIWQTWTETKANQADIARQCRVSPATVANILNHDRRQIRFAPPLPANDTAVIYRGEPGLVHHAFHCPELFGPLVGVYRHGPRKGYVGYVCLSQLVFIEEHPHEPLR